MYFQKIPTISLVNIHHLIWIQKKEKHISLLSGEVSGALSTSHMHHTTLLPAGVLLCVTPSVLAHLTTGNLYLWPLY